MWVNTEIKDFANADTRLCNVWSREYGEKSIQNGCEQEPNNDAMLWLW